MASEKEEPKELQYSLDSNSYKILDEIGVGVSAVVYKAQYLLYTNSNHVVAIKAIDLDRSTIDFDEIRREINTMSLLSHPNILTAYSSFTVDRRLWIVMPFMSAGSLQSIISSSFPAGLPEPCIAIVLKETLNALCYLHDQGYLHRDIKASNILVDSNGSVKLADFGVSMSIYETNPASFSSMMLTDVAGTPYWMAPEVIHSYNGYGFNADIWSFGITALELAYGRPPLSDLPLSESLIVKVTKRFRFSDYAKSSQGDDGKSKIKFSKAFKDMVGCCLHQDPSKRSSAKKLIKHPFFKNCKGSDYLVKKVVSKLTSVEERFKQSKLAIDKRGLEEPIVKERRISGWNFDEKAFRLEPIFPTDDNNDSALKRVRFAGETIIEDTKSETELLLSNSNSNSSSSCSSYWRQAVPVVIEDKADSDSDMVMNHMTGESELIVVGLRKLQVSMEEQREAVIDMIKIYGGEDEEVKVMSKQDEVMMELEREKLKNIQLEIQLDLLITYLQSCNGPSPLEF